MAGLQPRSFFEKMSAYPIPANISSVIPEGIHPYFISLTDDAVKQALNFATTAIFAYQYDAYGQNFALTRNKEAAQAAAVAEQNVQEIAWQLMTARRANMDGTAVVGETLSATFLTGGEARRLGCPVAAQAKDEDQQ